MTLTPEEAQLAADLNLTPEEAEAAKQDSLELMPLISRIQMKRWLTIARRYDVTLADIKDDPRGRITELMLIAGNEVLRLQTGKDCWDQVEEMSLDEISDLVVGHLRPNDLDVDEVDADKSVGVGTPAGDLVHGDRDAT